MPGLAGSVKYRLVAGLGACILLLVISGVIGIGSTRQANQNLVSVYTNNVLAVQALAKINETLLKLRGNGLSVLVRRDAAAGETFRSNLLESKGAIEQHWAEYLKTVKPGSEEAAQAKEVEQTMSQMWQAYERYATAMAQGDFDLALRLATVDTAARTLMVSTTDQLAKQLNMNIGFTHEAYEHGVAEYERMRDLFMAAIVIVSLLIAVFAVRLVRSIVRPLNQARALVHNITEGQLDNRVEIASSDEFGEMLKGLQRMDGRLADVVGGFRSGAEAVSSASQQLARGNNDLSSRTQEQAASLEQTAASMEEMTSTVRHNADNAGEADRLAGEMGQRAREGGEVVVEAVAAMEAINASSRQIVSIVSMIDDIAFQTNLLALNAAVEAARAGEQGRGFAVVAGEVRSLAGRASESAKEIRALVDDSVSKIENGSELVNRSGQTLSEIVTGVDRVSGLISEIAAASREQTSGIEQVGTAVVQMDQLTQQNAELVEEAAGASRELHERAESLLAQVAFFQLNERDVAHAAATGTSSTSRGSSRAQAPRVEPRRLEPSGDAHKPVAMASDARAASAPRMAGSSSTLLSESSEEEWDTF
ncbi:methyl-accepting chemotaxis protein [Kushneria phosphatilytica]|uniref:HAMP domain-containing protein n=1 Tax=Kushneria phosphatilytica TaxID=657387 RepID=A0A1S1NVK9_9GAMM|nr:methyl-accepting chemotaxis protein [Kushneria phosphatilytica]OHV07797.1 hypothetical protein BH688_16610 [Kushneria phosphatilytica]QEL10303.1 HAMP domain-containing protein [Kushneria phosphatilytica]